MIMTEEQRQDFNRLSREDKRKVSVISSEHPQWGFSQVMAKLAFDKQTEVFIERGGEDVNPNDPTIWRDILRGVKVTLSKLKSIGSNILNILDGAIKSLTLAIKAGIKSAGSIIRKIKDSLFY